MTLDLIVRHATLADGRTGVDIAVRDGRIVEIAAAIAGTAERELDAAGRLVTPPFVDAHFHLDATLTLGLDGKLNQSGTLAEGIRLWGELQPLLTADALRTRALAYCDLAVSQGLLAIRSHVDVSDAALMGAEVLVEVKKQVAPYLDLQLVAFPQMGYFSTPAVAQNVRRALDLGVDAVGGIPHYEATAELGRQSITALCGLAAERGALVDMHCDENDDPASRHVETLAYETRRLGLSGRVTGSHLCSMHSMDNFYAARLIGRMAEAGLAVVANPLANMVLQGRFDTYPKRRGMTRVPELMAAGCRVALGHDSVLDPWYPLGRADMLDVAHMAVHAGHMTSQAGMRACFAAVTEVPARILGLRDYGLAAGCHADFVILQARDAVDAIRLRPPRLAVVRRGRVIAEQAAARTLLSLPGRPETIDPDAPAAGRDVEPRNLAQGAA
ncbi:MAG: cytosine deaminase [Stellaceae bacterium]